MDGAYTLSYQDLATRQHGDEPARAGVQPQTCDGNPGTQATDGGDAGVRPVLRPRERPVQAFSATQGCPRNCSAKTHLPKSIAGDMASAGAEGLQATSSLPADIKLELSHGLDPKQKLPG